MGLELLELGRELLTSPFPLRSSSFEGRVGLRGARGAAGELRCTVPEEAEEGAVGVWYGSCGTHAPSINVRVLMMQAANGACCGRICGGVYSFCMSDAKHSVSFPWRARIRACVPYGIAAVLSACLTLLALFFFGDVSHLLDRARSAFGIQERPLLSASPLSDEGTANIPMLAVTARADRAFAAGNLTEALQLYEKALAQAGKATGEEPKAASSDLWLLRTLFDTALLLGNQAKAEEVLGLLSFHGVGEDVLDAFRGFLLLRKGERDGAKTLFAKNPESPESAYGLAIVAILTGAHEEAEAMLAQVKESSDPALVHAAETIRGAYDEFALFQEGKESHRKTLLARALAQVQQCPTATVLLQEVTEEEQDYRDAWIVLGYCRLALEDAPSALAAFEHAYALDPEKAETQYFLGLTHDRLGHAAEARTYLGYALQNGFEPERSVREKLASIAIAAGTYDQAIEQYRALLTKEEKDISLYSALVSLLLEHTQDTEGAGTLAKAARDALGDTPPVLDLLGWTALAKNDVNSAATFLNAAVQQDPSLASAWYHKGLLAENVGDQTEALKSYRKAYDLSLGIDDDLVRKAAERHNAMVTGKQK